MNKDVFKKMKELEERMIQLGLFKKYMESFLRQQPLSAKFELDFFGHHVQIPLQVGYENRMNFNDTDDGDYIIQSIQKRIDILQMEFDYYK